MNSTHTPHWESADTISVPADETARLVANVLFKRARMFEAEAKITADRMVEAVSWGYPEHGPGKANRLLAAMELGNIDPRAQTVIQHHSPALMVIDGSTGVGEVAGTRAADHAIKLAQDAGSATVLVRNSQSWGPSAAFAARMASAGLLAMCITSEGQPTVAEQGQAEPHVTDADGAWAFPGPDSEPIVFPTAIGRTSPSFQDRASLFGSEPELPATCATPPLLLQGFLSATLAGLLTGSKLPGEKRPNPELDGAEHFLYAVHIERCSDPETFAQRAAEWSAAHEAASPNRRIEKRPSNPQAKLELHRDELQPLIKLAARLKIETPLSAALDSAE